MASIATTTRELTAEQLEQLLSKLSEAERRAYDEASPVFKRLLLRGLMNPSTRGSQAGDRKLNTMPPPVFSDPADFNFQKRPLLEPSSPVNPPEGGESSRQNVPKSPLRSSPILEGEERTISAEEEAERLRLLRQEYEEDDGSDPEFALGARYKKWRFSHQALDTRAAQSSNVPRVLDLGDPTFDINTLFLSMEMLPELMFLLYQLNPVEGLKSRMQKAELGAAGLDREQLTQQWVEYAALIEPISADEPVLLAEQKKINQFVGGVLRILSLPIPRKIGYHSIQMLDFSRKYLTRFRQAATLAKKAVGKALPGKYKSKMAMFGNLVVRPPKDAHFHQMVHCPRILDQIRGETLRTEYPVPLVYEFQDDFLVDCILLAAAFPAQSGLQRLDEDSLQFALPFVGFSKLDFESRRLWLQTILFLAVFTNKLHFFE